MFTLSKSVSRNTKIVTISFILIATAIAIFIPACSKVEAQTTSTAWHWTPPAYGPGIASQAIKYLVQERINSNSWVYVTTVSDTLVVLNIPYDVVYEVRVAGQDALLRTGLWSLPSDPYTKVTPAPNAPGKPSRFIGGPVVE
jgi:hypothetical protein